MRIDNPAPTIACDSTVIAHDQPAALSLSAMLVSIVDCGRLRKAVDAANAVNPIWRFKTK